MTTSAISQFIGSVLAEKAGGVKPTVDRPKVARPSAYDDTRMDISDRFRPAQDYTDPASYGSSRDDDPTGPGAYRGSLNVTGIGQSVADQFVGAPRGLSAAMAPVGLSTFMGLGAAASLKNLQRIESNQQAGKVGNAVGMLNGRIIGVSPSPFGGYVLSGVLPPNLTHDQRKQIINQLLEMNPTTELVGGKLPTKDDPDPPPPTASATVVDKILSGVDPEAAGFEAGLVSGTLGRTGTGRTDAYVGQGGGTPSAAPVTPSAPAAPAPTTGNPFTDAIIQGMEGAAGAEVPDPLNDPSATASVTTATDASPPPPPPSSRPPDFVTYTPPQDDSDDDDRPSGTSYSIGSGAPVDAFNERPGLGSSPSPAPSDDSDDDDGGGGGGGGKIVCTAMNQAYGFGSFRQAIWLAHSRDMAPEYQAGYHAIFQPLVTYGYGGTTKTRKFVRGILEGIARRRTADIWMQKKGKRHPVGRIERAFWEPVCYAVGRIVLCLKK